MIVILRDAAGQEKMVIALDVDKSGARALSGAEDYKLKMFDFGGMKRDMRAFRTLEPEDSYPVNAISFSPTGGCQACGTQRQ